MMSGLENLTEHVGSYGVAGERIFGKKADRAVIPTNAGRDPKGMCGASDPFDLFGGLGSGRGYRSGAGHDSGTGGFSLGGFVRDVLTGAVTGGLGSAGVYGAGKAVEVLRGSVAGRGVRRGSGEIPVSGRRPDFYVAPNGDVIPATGYRYMTRKAKYISKLRKTMVIPSNEGDTYITFDRFDIPSPRRLQVPHDASIRGTFDTLQLADDLRIPHGEWGQADWLEPVAKDFPEYGEGGATQAVTNQRIVLDSLEDLLE